MRKQLLVQSGKGVLSSLRIEDFQHFKRVFSDGDVGDVGVPFFEAVERVAVAELSASTVSGDRTREDNTYCARRAPQGKASSRGSDCLKMSLQKRQLCLNLQPDNSRDGQNDVKPLRGTPFHFVLCSRPPRIHLLPTHQLLRDELIRLHRLRLIPHHP